MHAGLDPRTPVVIGGGQLNQRVDRGEPALEPVDLLAEALRKAAVDTGAPDPHAVLAAADTIAVVNIISWRYRDPGSLVATRIGAQPKRTWYTVASGNAPQSLLNRAAQDIRDGVADLVVIGGAEAWRTRTATRRADAHARPEWTLEPENAAPSWTLGDDTPLLCANEMARGVMMPVQIYPLFESAIRAAAGRTIAEHDVHLSELWSRFSAVAARNPNAWIQHAYTPEEIRSTDGGNRMVGAPYRKLMNSNSAVEQGAGFIVCSAERAEALGVPTDRWVFPRSGADARDTPFVSNRPDLGRSPAIRATGRVALELAEIGVDDLAHVDLYSCFPSAVEVAAAELGLAGPDGRLDGRDLTVTGGLSFAGGPWNNYVSHSITTMVGVLRAEPGALGLVTGNGGFLTKHAMGVYSTTPPPDGFRWASPQTEVDAAGSVELCEAWDGPATVEAYTVMHSREGEPELGIVLARLADGRRAWGTSGEADDLTELLAVDAVGRAVALTSAGAFALT